MPDGAPVGQSIETGDGRYNARPKFSDNGWRLLVVNEASLFVCDAHTGALFRPAVPRGVVLWDTSLTPDGRAAVLLTASTATLLDLDTDKPVLPPLVHDGPIYEAKIGMDGKTLFTNSVDGSFRLWDLKTGKLLAEPTFRQEKFAPAAFFPDGRTVAVLSNSGAASQMRLGGGPAAPLLFPRDASVAMVNVTMTAPTRLFWLTTTRVRIFDAASGRETDESFQLPETIPGTGSIRSTYGTKAGAGLTIVVRTLPANKPRTWRAWTVGDRGIAHNVELVGVPEDVALFTVNPTGQIGAATGNLGGSTTVGIWNLQTGQRATTMNTGSPVPAFNTIISPDEKRVAFRTDDGGTRVVHVCEVASGRELSTVQVSGRASISGIRFTSDSARLVTGDDWGGVQLWDAATGQLQRSTQAHRAVVRRLDFSDDGRFFASASEDGSVQVWESTTGAPVGPLLSQEGSAGKPDFNSDDTRIVTQSSSGSARDWDVRSGQPLTGLLDHDGATLNIAATDPTDGSCRPLRPNWMENGRCACGRRRPTATARQLRPGSYVSPRSARAAA